MKFKPLILKGIFLGCAISIASFCYAELSGPIDEDSIVKRLQPFGKLKLDGDSKKGELVAVAKGPADIYKNNCKMCHQSGLAGAPKLGDKGEWAKRASKGMDSLLKNAIKGFKAMPPKGGCMDCSDDDILKSINYMIDKSK